MQLVFQNINKELKPDRSVLFHDYGLYEHAMLRFKAGSKLGEKYYVRQYLLWTKDNIYYDGATSDIFTVKFLAQPFVDASYEEALIVCFKRQ